MPEPTNQEVLNTVGKMFSGLTDKVLKDVVAQQQSIIDKTDSLVESVDNKVTAVSKSITDVNKQVADKYQASMSAMSKAFTTQYNALEKSAKDRYETTKEYVSQKYNAISASVSSALTTISDQWESTKKSLIDAKNVLQEKIANVGAMVSTAMTRFKSSMDNAFRSVTGVIKGIGGSIMSGFNSVLGGFGRMKDFIFSSFAQLGSFLRLSFETITNPIEGLKKAMGGMMSLLFGGSMIKKLLMGALVGGAAAFGLKKLYDSNPAFKKFVDDMGAKVKNLLIGEDGKTGIIFGQDGKSGIWGTLKGWIKKAGSYLWTILFGDGAKEGEEKNGGLWQDFKNIMSGFGSWFMEAMFGPQPKPGEKPKGGWWQNDIWPMFKGLGKSIAELFVGTDGKSGWWHEYIVPALKTAWGTVQPILKTFFYGEDGKTGLVGNAKNWFMGKPNEWSDDNKPFWERVWGWIGGIKGLTALAGGALGATALANPMGAASSAMSMGGTALKAGKAVLGSRAGRGALGVGMMLGTEGISNIADHGVLGGIAKTLKETNSTVTASGLGGAIMAGSSFGPAGMAVTAVSYLAFKLGVGIGEIIKKQGDAEDMKEENKILQEQIAARQKGLTENFLSEMNSGDFSEAQKKALTGLMQTKTEEVTVQRQASDLSELEKQQKIEELQRKQRESEEAGPQTGTRMVRKMMGKKGKERMRTVQEQFTETEEEMQARIEAERAEMQAQIDAIMKGEGTVEMTEQKIIEASAKKTMLASDLERLSANLLDNIKGMSSVERQDVLVAAKGSIQSAMVNLEDELKLKENEIWLAENTKQFGGKDAAGKRKDKLARLNRELEEITASLSAYKNQSKLINDLEAQSFLNAEEFSSLADTGHFGLSKEQIDNIDAFKSKLSDMVAKNLTPYVADLKGEKFNNAYKGLMKSLSGKQSYMNYTAEGKQMLVQTYNTLAQIIQRTISQGISGVTEDSTVKISTSADALLQQLTEVNPPLVSATNVNQKEPPVSTEGAVAGPKNEDPWQTAMKETFTTYVDAYNKTGQVDEEARSKVFTAYMNRQNVIAEDVGIDPVNIAQVLDEKEGHRANLNVMFDDYLKNNNLTEAYPQFKMGAVLGRFRGGMKAILHEGEAVVSDLESERGDAWVSSFADKTMDKISSMKPDETTTLSKAIGVSPDDPMLATIKNLFAEQRAFIKECLYNNSGPSAELLEVNQQIAEALMEMNEKSTGDSMVLDSLINGLAEERKDASFAPPMEFRQGDIRA